MRDCEEGDEPAPAGLLGAYGIEQRPRLARVDHAPAGPPGPRPWAPST